MVLLNITNIKDPLLVVCAHPDDIEVHCGGTTAQLVAARKAVTCVLCTSGNRGTLDPTATIDALGRIREKEQRKASSVLGVKDLRFLGYNDGDLQFCVPQLREKIVRLVREVKPKTIITHDPYPGDGGLDSCSIYPDHITTGKVTFEAAFVCAPGPLFYPEHLQEGLSPHKPEIMYLIMSQNANLFTDIGAAWATKLKALHHHRSQGRHTPENDAEMERIARQNGQQAGVKLAEAFRLLRPS
jgi:LmbE family N-acetylglucosaminyl deacetylase